MGDPQAVYIGVALPQAVYTVKNTDDKYQNEDLRYDNNEL